LDDDELRWEYDAIRESAYYVLRNCKRIPLERYVPQCQFLILPSFDDPVSWDIVQTYADGDFKTHLYRTTWCSIHDLQTLESPEERSKPAGSYRPTFKSQRVLVDVEQLTSIVSRLQAIRIPLGMTDETMGLDGVDFELAMNGSIWSTRIQWWCDLPPEWQELKPAVTDLEKLLKSAWEATEQIAEE
jgi:hypothetical protein